MNTNRLIHSLGELESVRDLAIGKIEEAAVRNGGHVEVETRPEHSIGRYSYEVFAVDVPSPGTVDMWVKGVGAIPMSQASTHLIIDILSSCSR